MLYSFPLERENLENSTSLQNKKRGILLSCSLSYNSIYIATLSVSFNMFVVPMYHKELFAGWIDAGRPVGSQCYPSCFLVASSGFPFVGAYMLLLHQSAMSPVIMCICIQETLADPPYGGGLHALDTEHRRGPSWASGKEMEEKGLHEPARWGDRSLWDFGGHRPPPCHHRAMGTWASTLSSWLKLYEQRRGLDIFRNLQPISCNMGGPACNLLNWER